MHHADLYRLDTTGDVDELALHELAEFDGIVLVEWGDVAAATLGDHLEVRIEPDDADDPDTDDPDTDDRTAGEPPAGDDPDDFGLDGSRLITLAATGPGWAGRWDRLATAMEAYRC
jgi:tRNA threonylcarbamoyladenosine biosynthesis protein TsaE